MTAGEKEDAASYYFNLAKQSPRWWGVPEGQVTENESGFPWVCCTLYLGHLPNDFCVTSPTKLLHFPNNLSHLPNNLCHLPNTFSHFPNNFVSLCPPPKNLFFFFILLVFHISTSLHSIFFIFFSLSAPSALLFSCIPF